MRILHITFSLLNAGKENMLVDIANEQAEMGHDVAVVVLNEDVDETIAKRIGSRVRFFRLNRKRSGWSLVPLLKLFSVLHGTFRPDVIHSHDAGLGKMLYRFGRGKRVCTVHGHNVISAILHYYDRVFAVSRGLKNEIENKTGLECIIVYNGIITRQITKKQSYQAGERMKVISVGRLNHEIKGQDVLIEAARILVHDRGRKDLLFTLVGDGDSRNHLMQLVESYLLQNYVAFEGNKNRDWVYQYLCEYDIFVQASRTEAFGLTIAEAMAAGIPVISSNIEGPSEILDHGNYGLLFNNNNPESLANSIENMIGMYRSGGAEEFASKAYRRCIEHYDIKKTAQYYCMAYLA